MALGLGLGIQFRNKASGGGGLDPATQALLAKAATDGYTPASGDTLAALDTYIKGLKSAGVWGKLDVLYVPATNGDSDFATYNILDPNNFQATKVNSPTFTSLQGFTGDGSSSYLNTNYNPNDNGANYTLNNASYGYYVRVYNASGPTTAGARDESANNRNYEVFGTISPINSNSNGIFSNNTGNGFRHVNRSSSTNINRVINGTSESASLTSSALASSDFYLLCLNDNSTPLGFSTSQISVFFIGGNLLTEASDFYNLTQDYMTALGTEV